MRGEMTLDRLTEVRGSAVYSVDGEKLGKVEEIFYDEETRRPEWIGLGTGFFGTKRAVVPLEGASFEGDELRVPFSKEQVQQSPDIDGDEIGQDTERRLYSHYGLEYSERRSDTVLPEADAGMMAAGAERVETSDRDATVTRSEEELSVGKRDVPAGTARLRKWVETVPVQEDVEVRRETARVEREPIEQPVSDTEIGEQEVEVPLRAEEPVAEKRAVARERVSLEKDVDTDVTTVSEELRKEQVDVEEGVDRR